MGFLFRSLGGYQRSRLRGDVIAGLTVWAVLVSEALAYASIAGVSPVVGLASSPSPSSRDSIVGLALTIIIGQVPKLLGIGKGSGDFFEQLWHVITQLGDIQALTLLVG